MNSEEMRAREFKPVIIEVAELGKAVVKFTLDNREDYETWWSTGQYPEIPLYGSEALGSDF